MTQQNLTSGRIIGSRFLAVFGGLWITAWSVQVYPKSIIPLLFIGASTAVLLFYSIHLQKKSKSLTSSNNNSFNKKSIIYFIVINIIQWLAILMLAWALTRFGFEQWVVPTIIFIVGLHFLPLASVFKARHLIFFGIAMMLWAILYPALLPEGPAAPGGCLGAGLIIWTIATGALTG